MASKEGPHIYHLNLRIIQSSYGIIIDQTAHIQDTILSKTVPDAYEKFNSDPTPFKIDSTFGITLVDTLPATPAELHLL